MSKKSKQASDREKDQAQMYSKFYLKPSCSAAAALSELEPKTDIIELASILQETNSDIFDGDLTRAEAMLIDQAHVLQAIFTNFTSRMANSEYLSQLEAYGKIALRAQNQCQRTLKTLLEYKNPKRTTFIKQQNNAINQQINEGEQPKEISEKKVNSANELLEENHETRLDTGETQEAITVNSELETVGELDRTAHGTG